MNNTATAPVVAKSASSRSFEKLVSGLKGRLHGPGGFYNLGNAFGLLTGLLLHAAHMSSGSQRSTESFYVVFDYLAGSVSSLALTLSMIVFFWSGELYYRAWSRGFPPEPGLNRAGDLWSCWGALALGVGLLLLNQPVLALTAGLLHALGKYGSAKSLPAIKGWPETWPDCWRTIVLASRVPALMAVLIEMTLYTMKGDLLTVSGFGPMTLLVCYLLWLKADLLLLSD